MEYILKCIISFQCTEIGPPGLSGPLVQRPARKDSNNAPAAAQIQRLPTMGDSAMVLVLKQSCAIRSHAQVCFELKRK